MLIFILFLISLYVISFLIGKLIYSLIYADFHLENSIKQIFQNTISGISFIIILYALINAKLYTIYVIIIIPFLIYLYKSNLNFNKFNIKINKNEIVLFLNSILLLILCFFYLSIFTFDFVNFDVLGQTSDYHWYAEISRGLREKGQENFMVAFYDYFNVEGNSLYHFHDSWLVALISKLTHINTFDIQMMIVYPFFLFLTAMGIASLLENKIKPKIFLLFVSFILMFSISINLPLIKKIDLFNFYDYGINPGNYNQFKLLIIYPYLLLSTMYIKEFNIKVFFISILFLVTIYSTLIVSFIPPLFLLIIYLVISKNKSYSYSDTRSIIFMFISFCIILIFYKLYFVNSYGLIYKIHFLENFKTTIIVFIETLLKNSINYFPVVVFILLSLIFKTHYDSKYNVRTILIFFFISIFSATAFISIFHGTVDYSQALYNSLGPIMLSLLAFILGVLKKKHIKFILPLFLVIGLINMLSLILNKKDFDLQESKKFVSESIKILDDNKYIILIEKIPELESEFLKASSAWYYDVELFTTRLYYSSNSFNVWNDLTNKNKNELPSPFLKWLKSEGLDPNPKSLDKYLVKNKVSYVISTTDNEIVKNNKNYKLILKDINTNKAIYKFNNVKI